MGDLGSWVGFGVGCVIIVDGDGGGLVVRMLAVGIKCFGVYVLERVLGG